MICHVYVKEFYREGEDGFYWKQLCIVTNNDSLELLQRLLIQAECSEKLGNLKIEKQGATESK